MGGRVIIQFDFVENVKRKVFSAEVSLLHALFVAVTANDFFYGAGKTTYTFSVTLR
jgi:hypothetical protein